MSCSLLATQTGEDVTFFIFMRNSISRYLKNRGDYVLFSLIEISDAKLTLVEGGYLLVIIKLDKVVFN